MTANRHFVILSGPSGVGKGPLQAAVDRFYPGLLKARPVLCTSRPPRDNEVHGRHYYFLPRALIQSLQSSPDFLVSPVRSDWQAIDLSQVEELLESNDLVFAEVYYTFGAVLKQCAAARSLATSSVFLLPLPIGSNSDKIIRTMHDKLMDRGMDSPSRIKERASLAPDEMAEAQAYSHRLLNRATENDTDEWGELGTRNGARGEQQIRSLADLGPNAKWLVEIFMQILRGELPPGDYAPPTV